MAEPPERDVMNKSDMHLKNEVEAELEWDPKLNATKIEVAARNGAIVLKGKVDSYADKWAAEDAAKRIAGVRSLEDELTVKVLEHHHHTDAEIAEAALRALEWNVWIPEEVRATVLNGHVLLGGKVELNYQRDAAEQAIRHIAGVTNVRNEITVVPRTSATEVQAQIESALARQARADASAIGVSVLDGTVTLTGKVHSWHSLESASSAAWAAPGVKRVQNDLLLSLD